MICVCLNIFLYDTFPRQQTRYPILGTQYYILGTFKDVLRTSLGGLCCMGLPVVDNENKEACIQ